VYEQGVKGSPWAAFPAIVLAAQPAMASPAARLVYARDAAAMVCPAEGALRHAVSLRVGYDPFFPWATRTVVVQVTRDGEDYVAHLFLVDDQGASRGARELRSDDKGCAGLVDAAALAISIALDAADLADASARPSPATSAPAAPTTASLAGPTETQARPPDRPSSGATAAVPPNALRPVIGMDARVSTGVGPAPALGLAASVALRTRLLSLGVEVRADAPTSTSAQDGGRVETYLLAAGLVPCAHLAPVFGCLVGNVGALHVAGLDVRVPRSDTAVFVAAGPRFGVEVPLGQRLVAHAYGELLANLQRTTVVMDGASPWSAPAVAGTFGAGLLLRFP
jgi:hypothetical protein